jgi:hypothetical protein
MESSPMDGPCPAAAQDAWPSIVAKTAVIRTTSAHARVEQRSDPIDRPRGVRVSSGNRGGDQRFEGLVRSGDVVARVAVVPPTIENRSSS